MRIVVAALVGGLVMFAWGAFSHMALDLGGSAFRKMPDEAGFAAALAAHVREPGLYAYPGLGGGHDATEAERTSWEERYERGPRGLLVYHTGRQKPMEPKQLVFEFASNVAAALLAALMLARTNASFAGRVLLAVFLGVIGWLSIDVSYWNWHGFPSAFTKATLVEQSVGWLLVGLVLAAMVRGARAA